jgi:putative flippase GtrA
LSAIRGVARASACYDAAMPDSDWKPHLRQGAVFLVVGLAQLALDTGVFVASTALGLPVAPGNVLGRISGAALGFALHGRYTFADGGKARLSGRHLRRYVIAWTLMTVASTALLHGVATQASLSWAWLAKPFVEAVMAGVGFVVWRQWVFR